MRRLAVLGTITITLLATGQPAFANDTSQFKIEITPRQCTLDTLTTGVSQLTTIHPEDCKAAEQAATQASTSQNTAEPEPAPTTSHDDYDGNQAMFENTAFESLASLLGVGDKNRSSIGPVTTSLAFITATAVVIDAAFFGLRVTKPILISIRRAANATFRFLRRGVSGR